MADTTTIPFLYRLLFLFIEPTAAFIGAYLVHFDSQTYLTSLSPSPNARFTPGNKAVYDTLAATYLFFALNEAIVLRATNDVKVWQALLGGNLVCDVLHLLVSYSALGGKVFWNPAVWRWQDALTLGTLWGLVVVRLAFFAGVGQDAGAKAKRY